MVEEMVPPRPVRGASLNELTREDLELYAAGDLEERIDRLFEAAAEATQEAVLDALAASPDTTGRIGHKRPGLRAALTNPQG